MTNLNDLQQIREFVQIAESGSILTAAKILSMGPVLLALQISFWTCVPALTSVTKQDGRQICRSFDGNQSRTSSNHSIANRITS